MYIITQKLGRQTYLNFRWPQLQLKDGANKIFNKRHKTEIMVLKNEGKKSNKTVIKLNKTI